MFSVPDEATGRQWTLHDYVQYAIANNITLRKAGLQQRTANEDLKQSQAALLPTLDFSSSQNATFRPWPENGRATVANGYVQPGIDKVYYNGSYSVSANWTVWNGNRNRNTVKQNKIAAEKSSLDSAEQANSILEQIAQLYVQILYSRDAVEVSRNGLEASKTNEARGLEMAKAGKMSKADLAQLTAQRAQDEYNTVEAESNLRNYKRQLKQLLQITTDDEFDVAIPQTDEEMALQEIPPITAIYEDALSYRPEIRSAKLGIESSEIGIRIAKAQRLPTIGLTAGVATNTTSMSDDKWGTQLKNNFDIGGGITVSVPIFDNRATRTAINKAEIEKQSYLLDLQDKQTSLRSTIEEYWLQAITNQNKYKAAKASTESAKASYELLSEQFRQGLKNTVELTTGKNNLLSAQQNELQSKYLAILNINMLNFYRTGKIE